jgi:tetratricopeptide (TPR) repeat protein
MRRERYPAVVVPFGVPDGFEGFGRGVAALIHSMVRVNGESVALAQLFGKAADEQISRSLETFVPQDNWQALEIAHQEPPVELVLTGSFEPPTEARGVFQITAYSPQRPSEHSRTERFIDDDDDAGERFVETVQTVFEDARKQGVFKGQYELDAIASLKGATWSSLEAIIRAESLLMPSPDGSGKPYNLPASMVFLARAIADEPSSDYAVTRLASVVVDHALSPTTSKEVVEGAYRTVRSSLSDRPESFELQEALAVVCHRLGLVDELASWVAKILQNAPNLDARARLTALLASTLRGADRLEETASTLAKSLQIHGRASPLLLEYARLAATNAAWEDALTTTAEVLERDEGHAFAAAMLMHDLLFAARGTVSEERLAQEASRTGDRILAVAAANVGDVQRIPVAALRAALRLVREFEPNGIARTSRVTKLCAHLVEVNPTDVGAMLIAARTLANHRDDGDSRMRARHLLEQILIVAPESTFAADAHQGIFSLEHPNAEEELESIGRDATQEMPSQLDAVVERARAFARRHPVWPIHVAEALAEKRRGREEAAAIALERALEIAPGASLALAEMVDTLLTLGRNAEALTRAEKLCIEEQDVGPHHALRARALFAHGRFDEANEALAFAMKLDPDNDRLRVLKASFAKGPEVPAKSTWQVVKGWVGKG